MAFNAIWQLRRDTSRLLTEVDGTIGKGRTPVFNYVVRNLSKAVYEPDKWMPYEVYRLYAGGDLPDGVVEGVIVYFWDEPPRPCDLHLVVGRLTYGLSGDRDIEDACKIWDLYWAAFEWVDEFRAGEVLRVVPEENDRGVQAATILGVPLFSITSADDVVRHMERVRTA